MSTKPDHVEIPTFNCPTCGYQMDRTSGAFENAVPTEGDLSVCLKCGSVSEFDKNRVLSPLSQQKWEQLKSSEPETFAALKKVQGAIHKLFTGKN